MSLHTLLLNVLKANSNEKYLHITHSVNTEYLLVSDTMIYYHSQTYQQLHMQTDSLLLYYNHCLTFFVSVLLALERKKINSYYIFSSKTQEVASLSNSFNSHPSALPEIQIVSHEIVAGKEGAND